MAESASQGWGRGEIGVAVALIAGRRPDAGRPAKALRLKAAKPWQLYDRGPANAMLAAPAKRIQPASPPLPADHASPSCMLRATGLQRKEPASTDCVPHASVALPGVVEASSGDGAAQHSTAWQVPLPVALLAPTLDVVGDHMERCRTFVCL